MAWDSEPQTRLRALLIEPSDPERRDALRLPPPLASTTPPLPAQIPDGAGFTWVAARYPHKSRSPINAGAPVIPVVLFAVLAGFLAALYLDGIPKSGPSWPPAPGLPDRIPLLDMLARLLIVWTHQPDMRLAQIIGNVIKAVK